jgi:hypothetical protein
MRLNEPAGLLFSWHQCLHNHHWLEMTADEFWKIVGRAHQASGGDMPVKCEKLADDLRKLDPSEIESFAEHFREFRNKAYRWDLWNAAYLICGGCSDDGFTDFRSTLISMGRQMFEKALADPDSLAEYDLQRETASYEGYQYVAAKVYSENAGREVERPIGKVSRHSKRPAGRNCPEWNLSKKFPRLAAKYGHKDSNYEADRQRAREARKKFPFTVREAAGPKHVRGSFAELLIAAGLVASSGYIPPLPVVAEVIRTGIAPPESGRKCSWEPFEMDEGRYWAAVLELEGLKPRKIAKLNLDEGVEKLRQDFATPPSSKYGDWLRSLSDRGMAPKSPA